ncbi:hypothetical protein OE88DRAFT_1653974 [Heliocybe sulcata]|uniref:Secreted protein n=1 Tax=Heliocybe sulcata TaxID=5364 RepID=A0A5C3NEB1_9AGAM|nr:hypothetical protein OE88DRAFT_1653974 [Heliocybe sulcata]
MPQVILAVLNLQLISTNAISFSSHTVHLSTRHVGVSSPQALGAGQPPGLLPYWVHLSSRNSNSPAPRLEYFLRSLVLSAFTAPGEDIHNAFSSPNPRLLRCLLLRCLGRPANLPEKQYLRIIRILFLCHSRRFCQTQSQSTSADTSAQSGP